MMGKLIWIYLTSRPDAKEIRLKSKKILQCLTSSIQAIRSLASIKSPWCLGLTLSKIRWVEWLILNMIYIVFYLYIILFFITVNMADSKRIDSYANWITFIIKHTITTSWPCVINTAFCFFAIFHTIILGSSLIISNKSTTMTLKQYFNIRIIVQ